MEVSDEGYNKRRPWSQSHCRVNVQRKIENIFIKHKKFTIKTYARFPHPTTSKCTFRSFTIYTFKSQNWSGDRWIAHTKGVSEVSNSHSSTTHRNRISQFMNQTCRPNCRTVWRYGITTIYVYMYDIFSECMNCMIFSSYTTVYRNGSSSAN